MIALIRPKLRIGMIFVGLLLATSTLAAPYTGPDPARLLLLSGDSCGFALSMKPLTADAAELAKLEDDRKKALASIEENGPAATKFSGNSAEVAAAVKDFYLAADSYCKNPSSQGKADFETKEKLLDKLLEAAGR